jgi:hypothetical protein
MSKIRVVGMDVVTKQSGRSIVPVAPLVCTMPAFLAPVQVPSGLGLLDGRRFGRAAKIGT